MNKYLVVHCSDTPEDRDVCTGMIKLNHLAPSYIRSKQLFHFMGENYKLKTQIKPYFVQIEKNGKVDISQRSGRGWSSVGYHAMIRLSGSIEIFDWNNKADFWGVKDAMHIVYVGGSEKIYERFRPKDTLNNYQFIALANFIKVEIAKNPELLVCGHNQFNNHYCPSFEPIEKFLKMGIPLKNIYNPKELDLMKFANEKGIKL